MTRSLTFATVASYDGYCVRCDVERPLVVQTRGAHGFRAWLAGVGLEDRELSYTCRVCGQVEHVPQTEAEDVEYAATLPTWPDWQPAVVVELHERRPVVRVITLPIARVSATDLQLAYSA